MRAGCRARDGLEGRFPAQHPGIETELGGDPIARVLQALETGGEGRIAIGGRLGRIGPCGGLGCSEAGGYGVQEWSAVPLGECAGETRHAGQVLPPVWEVSGDGDERLVRQDTKHRSIATPSFSLAPAVEGA